MPRGKIIFKICVLGRFLVVVRIVVEEVCLCVFGGGGDFYFRLLSVFVCFCVFFYLEWGLHT
jgi:hypothetical protein